MCHEGNSLLFPCCINDGGLVLRSLLAGVGFKPANAAAFKRCGGERLVKRPELSGQVCNEKMSESEPTDESS